MDYKCIYEKLILKAKNRNIKPDYTESHHIIPRCIGGDDSENNLVDLTPEEHYVAHQLLTKIYPDNDSLIYASLMMITNRPSNKLYGWLRRRFAKAKSKEQSGEGNSQFGTKWVYNKELRVCKKIAKDTNLESGWELGRIINFEKFFEKEELKIRQQIVNEIKNKETILKRIKTKHFLFKKTKQYRKAKSIKLYTEFKHCGISLRKFAKMKEMNAMTLSKWFREFIPEYGVVDAMACASSDCKSGPSW